MSKIFSLPGWESGPIRVRAGITSPPPPPPPTTLYRKFYGVFTLPEALWGDGPILDTCFSDSNGSNYVGAGGHIAALRAAGARAIIKITGGASSTVANGEGTSLTYPAGNPLVDGEKGTFSPTILKSNVDIFFADMEAAGGAAEFEDAVGDGVIGGILAADDYSAPRSSSTSNGYISAVTYPQLEDISGHILSHYLVPVGGRVKNSYHRATAADLGPSTLGLPRINGVRQYVYFGFGWMQHRATHDGDPVAYFANEYLDGVACALAGMSGANQLRRGKGPPSVKFPNSDGWAVRENCESTDYTLSPAELRKVLFAAIRNTDLAGPILWAHKGGAACNSDWFDRPEIQAVYQEVANEMIGLTDPPLHRHPLVAP